MAICDLLEDRHINNGTVNFFTSLLYKRSRFQSGTLALRLVRHFLVLIPHFDVICGLLLNRHIAGWNLFVNSTYRIILFQWLAPSEVKSTYSVCDIKAKKPSNWLTSDSLYPRNVKEIHITINYTISLRCASLRKDSHRRNCKEEFDVYGYQILGEANGSNLDQKKGNFSKIKTVSPSGNISNMSAIPWEVAKFSLPIKERTSSVILAIHDSGACIVLNSFMVTYRVCPNKVLPDSLLILPQTVAPTNESEIVRVSGKCVDNSKETSQGSEAICGKNGKWILADSAKEACLCNPGWERDVAKCRGNSFFWPFSALFFLFFCVCVCLLLSFVFWQFL